MHQVFWIDSMSHIGRFTTQQFIPPPVINSCSFGYFFSATANLPMTLFEKVFCIDSFSQHLNFASKQQNITFSFTGPGKSADLLDFSKSCRSVGLFHPYKYILWYSHCTAPSIYLSIIVYLSLLTACVYILLCQLKRWLLLQYPFRFRCLWNNIVQPRRTLSKPYSSNALNNECYPFPFSLLLFFTTNSEERIVWSSNNSITNKSLKTVIIFFLPQDLHLYRLFNRVLWKIICWSDALK